MKPKPIAKIFNAQLVLANRIATEKKNRRWTITQDANGWYYVTEVKPKKN